MNRVQKVPQKYHRVKNQVEKPSRVHKHPTGPTGTPRSEQGRAHSAHWRRVAGSCGRIVAVALGRVAERPWPYRSHVPRVSKTVSWALLCAVSQETLAACPLPSHNTPRCITIHLLPPQATAPAAVSRYNFFVSRHSPSAY